MNSEMKLASARIEPVVNIIETSYKLMKNYNYLIVDPRTFDAVIVDPSWELEKIGAVIESRRAKLRGVLITHSHADHIHLAHPVAEKYECPIWMSKTEISISGFTSAYLIGIEENPFSAGGLEIHPIFTPGHTPGCMCYLIGDNVFTGDVLFAEGCGMCQDVDSAFEMYESLQKLKHSLKPTTHVYPGHSYGKLPGQAFSSLLTENIYLQFRDKEIFSAFRLRRGQNINKMFDFK